MLGFGMKKWKNKNVWITCYSGSELEKKRVEEDVDRKKTTKSVSRSTYQPSGLINKNRYFTGSPPSKIGCRLDFE